LSQNTRCISTVSADSSETSSSSSLQSSTTNSVGYSKVSADGDISSSPGQQSAETCPRLNQCSGSSLTQPSKRGTKYEAHSPILPLRLHVQGDVAAS
jgi:hypothetical protein